MVRQTTRFCSVVMAAALSAAVVLPTRAQDGSDTVYQMQALLEEVRELRGLVEAQQRELENLRRRQRDQYLDLDQRLQALGQDGVTAISPLAEPVEDEASADPEADDAGSTAPEAPVIADVPDVRAPIDAGMEVAPLAGGTADAARDLGTPTEEEQAAYDRAFRALREQRYADAAEGFSTFLDRFPESSYAPNALYWLAETYYVTRDFETALRFFDQLRERYPGSSKEGDALLKVGFSHFELRQWTEARAALEQVRSEHSGTTLARLAESRLRDMRLAGHF
ncbi:tol-pal system protein YbgF [Wenzhouxiangella limi]|uniref:Cell division coordinator CpoB n=1 Tax=Wenzhouxiangella limi TaxID=2707351 RepID=A0A845V446_9GAMM|nr:tol-pal system protein YbgF [Wenzhouxiangella limi]NDY95001.1 tol-pal system protein YbgF [Wenzhouxiangella limi]